MAGKFNMLFDHGIGTSPVGVGHKGLFKYEYIYNADNMPASIIKKRKDTNVTVSTTNFFYSSDGNLLKKEEILDGKKIITTINYDSSGNITGQDQSEVKI